MVSILNARLSCFSHRIKQIKNPKRKKNPINKYFYNNLSSLTTAMLSLTNAFKFSSAAASIKNVKGLK